MSKLDGFFNVEEVKKKKKILMFDFHNLVYRTIFISAKDYKDKRFQYVGGMSNDDFTKEDMYHNWKTMIINSLLYAIRDKGADKVIIANDTKNSWRKSVYSEYKANRKDARTDSIVDFEEFFPILEEFTKELESWFTNFYFLKIDRCEGDDIIAVLTKKYGNSPDYEIELISTDKDFIQLQHYLNFKQYNPTKKEYVISLNPKKDLEIKILTGDNSDNIPNVKPRLGVKTAEKLLNEGLVDLENDAEFKENYIRNKTLIDFSKIPDDIEEVILHKYENYDIKPIDGIKLGYWLDENNFKVVHNEWHLFYNIIKDLS